MKLIKFIIRLTLIAILAYGVRYAFDEEIILIKKQYGKNKI